MGGHIHRDGHNGAITSAESREICICCVGLQIRKGPREPEGFLAERMGGIDPFRCPLTSRLPTDLPTTENMSGGQIDVEADILGQSVLNDTLTESSDGCESIFTDGFILIALPSFQVERNAHGGHSFHTPFEDGPHRATIMDADTGIVTMIDATEDKGWMLGKYLFPSELHAIYRSA